ncbi:MAG: type 4a pilus biogenesis protein PilO [Thermodesulfobacteriota bacterium]|nr:type 4a pilus biogenesis protein PilO [Thermodesulfobacteriota bacterium]
MKRIALCIVMTLFIVACSCADRSQSKIGGLKKLRAELNKVESELQKEIKLLSNFAFLLSPRKGGSSLIDVSQKAKRLDIQFCSIKPREESRNGYTKDSFSMDISGSYFGISRFIKRVEDDMGAKISSIKIEKDNTSSSRLQAELVINIIRLDNDVFLALKGNIPEKALGLDIEPLTKEAQIRDPFKKPYSKTSTIKKKGIKKPINISSRHTLSGILQYPRYMIAIIDNTPLKEGDYLKGKSIESIQKSKVLLKDKTGQRYYIKLTAHH